MMFGQPRAKNKIKSELPPRKRMNVYVYMYHNQRTNTYLRTSQPHSQAPTLFGCTKVTHSLEINGDLGMRLLTMYVYQTNSQKLVYSR